MTCASVFAPREIEKVPRIGHDSTFRESSMKALIRLVFRLKEFLHASQALFYFPHIQGIAETQTLRCSEPLAAIGNNAMVVVEVVHRPVGVLEFWENIESAFGLPHVEAELLHTLIHKIAPLSPNFCMFRH